jgi:hypothetical protein
VLDREDIGADVQRWRLPDGTEWMGAAGTRDMYERPTWRLILELCIQSMVGPTVTANRGVAVGYVPGIGKTMFLNRLLMELHHHFPEKSVLFFDRFFEEFVLFDWPSCHARWLPAEEAFSWIKSAERRDTLIVVDDPSRTQRGPLPGGPPYFAACSGGAMNSQPFKEDRKQAGLRVATMDPLTEEEAVVVLTDIVGVPEERARALYDEWGGSLRHLVASAQGEEKEQVTARETAFRTAGVGNDKGVEFSQLIALVAGQSFASHFLFHEFRKAQDEPRSVRNVPASKKVASRIVTALKTRGPSELASYVNSLHPGIPQFWSGFEDLAHVKLQAGGPFPLLAPPCDDNEHLGDLKLAPDHVFDSLHQQPFIFSTQSAKLFEPAAPDAAAAQQKWQDTPASERKRVFKVGVDAGLQIKTASAKQVQHFLHVQTTRQILQLPEMVTVPVEGVAGVHAAISERSARDKTEATYFQPIQHTFPGIDSFALVPDLADSSRFQSALVLFQVYAGAGAKKHVKHLDVLRKEFENAGVLKPGEQVNVVLVVPERHLHLSTTLEFAGGEENLARQWKLSV